VNDQLNAASEWHWYDEPLLEELTADSDDSVLASEEF